MDGDDEEIRESIAEMHRSRHLLPLNQAKRILSINSIHRSWISNYFRILIHIFLVVVVAEVGIENYSFLLSSVTSKWRREGEKKMKWGFEKESSEREGNRRKKAECDEPVLLMWFCNNNIHRRWMVSERCVPMTETHAVWLLFPHSLLLFPSFSHTFHFPDFLLRCLLLTNFTQLWRFVFLFSEEELPDD